MLRILRFLPAIAGLALLGACETPTESAPADVDRGTTIANAPACWGQATKVFAMARRMGAHASGEETPRAGLANLARALYDDGVISEPTMEALGAFVAAAEGLEIDACL